MHVQYLQCPSELTTSDFLENFYTLGAIPVISQKLIINKLLCSQYNEIVQQKFLSLFELDLREFEIKYNTFITVMPKST